MKRNPMVTISLPCYNHEKYVRESIESVLAQIYQDYELVIIENGSTDHSKDIIEEYEDRATVIFFIGIIRIIMLQKHLGKNTI